MHLGTFQITILRYFVFIVDGTHASDGRLRAGEGQSERSEVLLTEGARKVANLSDKADEVGFRLR